MSKTRYWVTRDAEGYQMWFGSSPPKWAERYGEWDSKRGGVLLGDDQDTRLLQILGAFALRLPEGAKGIAEVAIDWPKMRRVK